MNRRELVKKLSGKNFWQTKEIGEAGSLTFTDGPHGVRMQEGNLELSQLSNAALATAFPTASSLASSWDVELVQSVAQAIGVEAKNYGVDVLLAPGMNIKRLNNCGRNFEYFSEDPYLSGKLATAYIQGVHDAHLMCSIKHFVCNNQEYQRMMVDSIVDDRALHDIYLRGFKMALDADPDMIMCGYNKLNGSYCSSSSYLLTNILRDLWKYEGVVLSDWTGCLEPVEAIRAGLNLEMPFSEYHDHLRLESDLSDDEICQALAPVEELAKKAQENREHGVEVNFNLHHELARKAASESQVLLQNNGVLPLSKTSKIALVGPAAKRAVIQGEGSSYVKASKTTTLYDEFMKKDVAFLYHEGVGSKYQEDFAIEASEVCDITVFCAETFMESEGQDRRQITLLPEQESLLQKLITTSKQLVLLLYCGAAVEIPQADEIDAIMLIGLAGQGSQEATMDLLYGEKSPCGKLAESFPYHLQNSASYDYYDLQSKLALYKESIYVGYRFYQKTNQEVLFSFGHGLSYAEFEYRDLKIQLVENCVQGSFIIKNKGSIKAKEIYQVYVGVADSKCFRPKRELISFGKVLLEADEQRKINFVIPKDELRVYRPKAKQRMLEEANYTFEVGASSVDIRLKKQLEIAGDENFEEDPKHHPYYHPTLNMDDKDFEEVLGRSVIRLTTSSRITPLSSLHEIKNKRQSKKLMKRAMEKLHRENEEGENFELAKSMLLDSPLITLASYHNIITPNELFSIIDFINGDYVRGIYHKLLSLRKPY